MIIMQTLFGAPEKLFEKYSHDVNRNTQRESWEKIALELTNAGIIVKDIVSLKTNVHNWTRRALVSRNTSISIDSTNRVYSIAFSI